MLEHRGDCPQCGQQKVGQPRSLETKQKSAHKTKLHPPNKLIQNTRAQNLWQFNNPIKETLSFSSTYLKLSAPLFDPANNLGVLLAHLQLERNVMGRTGCNCFFLQWQMTNSPIPLHYFPHLQWFLFFIDINGLKIHTLCMKYPALFVL